MTEKYWGIHSRRLPALVSAIQTLAAQHSFQYTCLRDSAGAISYFLRGRMDSSRRNIADWGKLLAAVHSELYQNSESEACLHISDGAGLSGYWQHWCSPRQQPQPDEYQTIQSWQPLPHSLVKLRPALAGRFLYCPDRTRLACLTHLLGHGIEVRRALRLDAAYLFELAGEIRDDFLLLPDHIAPVILLAPCQGESTPSDAAPWLVLYLSAPYPTLLVTGLSWVTPFPCRDDIELSNWRRQTPGVITSQLYPLPGLKSRPAQDHHPIQGLWLKKGELPGFCRYWRSFPDWYLRHFSLAALDNGEALVVSWEKPIARICFGTPFYCWWKSADRFVFVPCGSEPQLPREMQLPVQQFPDHHVWFWIETDGEFDTSYCCALQHLYPIDHYLLTGI